MELSEWAKLILFEPALQQKLTPMTELSDKRPNTLKTLPKIPARDVEIEIAEANDDTPIPENDWQNDTFRAYLLNSFANHELLALEIMAFVLLKFPDIPAAVRKGIASTMRDEQRHLGMYIKRIRELGYHFGDFPLNRFLWDCFNNISDISQYMAGMSLTFEQANLDHCLFFAKKFDEIGDSASSSIMKEIYHDEIGHVHLGVQWFKKHSNGQKELWQNYFDNLLAPVTPARAKGKVFDIQGRKRAGLDDRFIEKIKLFHRSKGRPPILYIWNLAKNQTANKIHRKITEDLEHLFLFCANKFDSVVLRNSVPERFLSDLADKGLDIPEILVMEGKHEEKRLAHTIEYYDRRIASFNEVEKDCNALNFALQEKPPICDTSPSKSEDLRRYLQSPLQDKWPITSFICNHISELKHSLQDLPRDFDIVMKGNHASSGHDWVKTSHEHAKDVFERLIKKHDSVIIESYDQRLADFSILFHVNSVRKTPFQIIRTICTKRGKFQGVWCHGDVFHEFDSSTKKEIYSLKGLSFNVALEQTYGEVTQWLKSTNYEGRGSIDGYIFRDRNEEIKLRPLCEINKRWTMGHIAKNIQSHFGDHHPAVWLLLTQNDLAKTGISEWSELHRFLTKHFENVVPTSPIDMRQTINSFWLSSPALYEKIQRIDWLHSLCYPLKS